jgi:hypothetical protein
MKPPVYPPESESSPPPPRTRALAIMASAMCLFLSSACTTVAGWLAPGDELSFPTEPVRVTPQGRFYDVDGNGLVDFALAPGGDGRLDVLRYDDDEDGEFDRAYRLSDYDPRAVPHLILLVDSLPHRVVSERYRGGDWTWFHPPQKVIPPFPSMTTVIFGQILHSPPPGGIIERYFDRRDGEIRNLWTARALSDYRHPWQLQLDSHLASYLDVGCSYLAPRPWYHAELARVKAALDGATHRVCIAYVVSSSAMLSRFGEVGLNECLQGIEQLCVQLLYERQGAIEITVISDHGHNLHPSVNFPVEAILEEGGFRPGDEIEDKLRDVIIEIDGLVTYFGVHTSQPAAVADLFLRRPEIELATYVEGHSVLVRDARGAAAIDHENGRYRYSVRTADVLGYQAVLSALAAEGKVDGRGFVSDEDWFAATVDLDFPDAPRRLWDAFHGQVVNPPQILFTLRDGHCAGMESMESWIEMQSTHGGLNRINSDAVILTTIGPVPRPLRSRNVLDAVEPEWCRGGKR